MKKRAKSHRNILIPEWLPKRRALGCINIGATLVSLGVQLNINILNLANLSDGFLFS